MVRKVPIHGHNMDIPILSALKGKDEMDNTDMGDSDNNGRADNSHLS